jgi:alpha,alpha-trehalase
MRGWTLVYEHFDPEQEGLREALCTLGNGMFATRGAAPEATADGVHYPGTYAAGVYDRLTTEIAGEQVENEDLVNLPNWLPLAVRLDGGGWLDLRRVEVLEYRQTLDLRQGVLERMALVRDERGRRTRLRDCRFVHMSQPHLTALQLAVTAENWAGRLTVRTALDGRVENAGVERYRDLAGRHLVALAGGRYLEDAVWLKMTTCQSEIRIAEAARTRVFRAGAAVGTDRRLSVSDGYVAETLEADLAHGETLTVEKIAALHTSRDAAISECSLAVRGAVQAADDFEALRERHARAWEELWSRVDLEIACAHNGDEIARTLRLHLFHILQTASPHLLDLDAGVPARGLTGEAYRGHVFWDELFVMPFLDLHFPAVAREVLRSRSRRLDAARAAARGIGLGGALFPWQSGSTGREESQRIHLNPRSGDWIPDHSLLQRHVNGAIAYNVWQHYQATGDREYLADEGAELLLEIARLWAGLATYNPGVGRYEILGVMGPDEYHESYPWSDRPGLDNNAYTNLLAVWVLCRALEALDLLPDDRRAQLCKRLGLTGEELRHWEDVSRRMRLCFHGDGILSQFEGYERLAEFDWEGYRRRYGDIQRLDRILEAEGDTPNRYQASKQADVLMLFHLFSAEQLAALFERLGYPFRGEMIPKNIDYYMRRTSHGSTLSRVVHAWVLARADRRRSWTLFTEALTSDVADIQGGTTPEGVHLGAMAGTVDIVQRCYTGLAMHGETLCFNPALPEDLERLHLRLQYRGHSLAIDVTPAALTLRALWSAAPAIRLDVRGVVHELAAGETRTFDLRAGRA